MASTRSHMRTLETSPGPWLDSCTFLLILRREQLPLKLKGRYPASQLTNTLNANRLKRAVNLQGVDSITISDDLSHISKLEERQFHALHATRDATVISEAEAILKIREEMEKRTHERIQRTEDEALRGEYETLYRDFEARRGAEEALRRHRAQAERNQSRVEGRTQGRGNVPNMRTQEADSSNQEARRELRMTPGSQYALDNSTGLESGPSRTGDVQTPLKHRLPDSASGLDLEDQVLGLDLIGLRNYIGRLTKRATYLEMSSVPKSQPTHRHLILYRIQSFNKVLRPGISRPDLFESVLSAPFLDAPEWIGAIDQGTLHCKVPIQNFDLFLEKNKDIAFIVFKTYAVSNSERYHIASETDDPPEITINETIKPITKELVAAVRLLLGSRDEYADLWHDFKATSELSAPYLFVYHQRGYTDTQSDTPKKASQEQLTLLWNYIIQKHGNEYTTADALLSSGKITSAYVKYLFKPGDILVQRKADFCLGWVAKSWAKHVQTYQTSRANARTKVTSTPQIPLYGSEMASKEAVNERVWVQTWTIPAWNWCFDGSFQRNHDELSFSIVTEDDPGPGPSTTYASKARAKGDASAPEGIPISDLEVFPIRYAPQEVTRQLRRRGKAFWNCRNRKLVSYEEHANDSQGSMVSSTSEVMIAY